jgi:hypothetical protein
VRSSLDRHERPGPIARPLTSGQYGIFGSVVSVVKDDGGGQGVRRPQVYQSNNEAWVVGAWDTNLTNNTNCGAHYGVNNFFVSAADHPYDHDANPGERDITALQALTSASRRYYLGGDSTITNTFVVPGEWLPLCRDLGEVHAYCRMGWHWRCDPSPGRRLASIAWLALDGGSMPSRYFNTGPCARSTRPE